MTDAIRFWFRGGVVELSEVPPGLSVLHWLREVDRSPGTKEGCNQGDCGACTVVLAEPAADGIALHTANSCLLLLPKLHGRALFTVEDVSADGALHPVQRAMVDLAGSQCGFCTPGFVMSMWRAAEDARATGFAPGPDDLAEALTGNLCRCTGYRPILDAAVAATREVAKGTDIGSIDRTALREALLRLEEPGTLRVASGAGAYVAPDTEEALAAELADAPGALVASGGTDLVLSLRASGNALRDDLTIVSTDRVAGMAAIGPVGDHLVIGAAARLDDAWAELARRLPALDRMWRRFASPAIRAVGTVGGNIANASPIADLTPVLLALDAELHLRSIDGTRVVALADFATGVRRTVLEPGEFISSVAIPLTALARDLRSYKVSRRFDDDISTVSGTFGLALDEGRVVDVRVVLGGMATTVRRAVATEQALLGRDWTGAALDRAQEVLVTEFTPISDHRASDYYRRKAASGLLRRWWLETGSDAPSVPLDVWTYR
jgi:xanthine dehydrogenase small subunit